MPITITPAPPNSLVGPGLLINWSSDFIGPLPSGSFLQTIISTDSEGSNWIYQQTNPTTLTGGSFRLMDPAQLSAFAMGTYSAKDNDTIHVVMELHEPSSIIDSGSQSVTYSATSGLGQLQLLIANDSGISTGILDSIQTTVDSISTDLSSYLTVTVPSLADGLTSILAGLQTTIRTAAGDVITTVGDFLSQPFPFSLLESELTSGETCDPFIADIGGAPAYALIVKCTTIAEWFGVGGLDSQFYEPFLAEVVFTRGGEEFLRTRIHTPTYEFVPIPGIWNIPVLSQLAPIVAPGVQVAVYWNDGVCGQVFTGTFP